MKLIKYFIFACLSFLYSYTAFAAQKIQAGEAYVTRFSGIDQSDKETTIDVNGTVGSIIDLREPKMLLIGQHWLSEPQRVPIFAEQVGQIFGVAIDTNNRDIYVSATSKFGLHRTDNNKAWLPGMWGKNGGPGTIYRLQAKNGYQPEIFANIKLNGRINTGASLGNIAYAPKLKQLFVSDLETGMIHRLDVKTGKELGIFNHGEDGRSVFFDVKSNKVMALAVTNFEPNSQANIKNCPTKFDITPSCWSLASKERRVWGLGINTTNNQTRLYYSAWSSNDDKQSTIWSIQLLKDGSMDIKSVRREFKLPASNSNALLAVSDLAFSNKNEMLIAENGELRNLGLNITEPFSKPHKARLFLYIKNKSGVWLLKGRYNIGGIDQGTSSDLFTSTAGGTDFGYAYTPAYTIDLFKPYGFVWATGDALCSAKGPCFEQKNNDFTDADEVSGLQGRPKSSYIKVPNGKPDSYMNQSFLIDSDLNVLNNGRKSPAEADKNDVTKIGDVEIYKIMPAINTPVHSRQISEFHHKYKSGLHNRLILNPIHTRKLSHRKYGSHYRKASHLKYGSHYRKASHLKYGSHNRKASHLKYGSHYRKASHLKYGSHYRKASHLKYGSHNRKASHLKYGSHNRKASHLKSGSHNRKASHLKYGSHNRKASHLKSGSHNRKASHLKSGSHNRKASHLKSGSHNRKASHLKSGSHNRKASHLKYGSHNRKASHLKYGSHNRKASHLKSGSHNRKASHLKSGSHYRKASHLKYGSHNRKASHLKSGSHNRKASHRKSGSQIIIYKKQIIKVIPQQKKN